MEMSLKRIMELIMVLIFSVTFATVNGRPSSEEPSLERGNKENRQFDLNRDNYDPYDAQASAVAFRRYKEAQALKEQGHLSNAHGHGPIVNEDALAASTMDDKVYEKKFYDPFFYFNGQSNGNNQYPVNAASRRHGRLAHYQAPYQYSMLNGMPVRNRRNTGTTASTISDGIDNNLLNEDVYFFRRDPDRNKQRLAEFEKSPYFYRESVQIQPEERQFPVSRTTKERFGPTTGRSNANDLYFSRLEQQPRYNTNFGPRPMYYQQYQELPPRFGPSHSHTDFNTVDGPRIRESSLSMPRTLAPAPGLPGVNGWAVQVGTQLRVHDDGRTRHPHRYYVKDEKPRPIGRYPNQYDRQ